MVLSEQEKKYYDRVDAAINEKRKEAGLPPGGASSSVVRTASGQAIGRQYETPPVKAPEPAPYSVPKPKEPAPYSKAATVVPVQAASVQQATPATKDYGLFGNIGAAAVDVITGAVETGERGLERIKPGLSEDVRGVVRPVVIGVSNPLRRSAFESQTRAKFKSEIKESAALGTELAGSFFAVGKAGQVIGGVGKAVAGSALVSRAIAPASIYVSRAPVVSKVADVASKAVSIGGAAAAKVPAPVKSGVVYSTGAGLEYYGATSTSGEKEAQAKRGAISELGGSEERRLAALEVFQAKSIEGGLTGSQKVDAENKVIESVKAEVGGDDLVGVGQRFALQNVPGLTPFFAPRASREAAIIALKSQGYDVTEENIKRVQRSGESVGVMSAVGSFASETGSEFLGSQLIRKGSFALSAAKKPGEQALALGGVLVPKVAAVGVVEGAVQTANVQTLTRRQIEPLGVVTGGLIGGASAGGFAALQAVSIPYGFRKPVQAAGYAIDFPGEPVGDILEGAISKAAGRGPGLRVRTFGAASSVQAAGGKQPGFVQNLISDVKGETRVIAGSRFAVDEFGLPVSTTPETRGKFAPFSSGGAVSTPANTNATTQTNGRFGAAANIFNESVNTNVNVATNVNIPSFVNVNTLVPNRSPFLPPGRLAGEGTGGGGRTRLGYIDELSAALTGVPLRSVRATPQKGNRGRPLRIVKMAPRKTRNLFGEPKKTSKVLGRAGAFGARLFRRL